MPLTNSEIFDIKNSTNPAIGIPMESGTDFGGFCMIPGANKAAIIPNIIRIASKGIEIVYIDFFQPFSFLYIHIDIW